MPISWVVNDQSKKLSLIRVVPPVALSIWTLTCDSLASHSVSCDGGE